MRALPQDDRAFELARMAGAAFEFFAEPLGPGPPRDVGKDDRQELVGASQLHRFRQGRQMLGVEVHVCQRQELKASAA